MYQENHCRSMWDKDTFKSFELEFELRKEADKIYQRYNRAAHASDLFHLAAQEIEETLDDENNIDLEEQNVNFDEEDLEND